jgi:hypothetical protein
MNLSTVRPNLSILASSSVTSGATDFQLNCHSAYFFGVVRDGRHFAILSQ